MNETIEAGLKRTAELSAIFMIGNGLLGLLQPERHLELWKSDVPAIDVFTRADQKRSVDTRRALGLLQVGAGILLASQMKAPTGK